jgi:hypothetical protein
MPNIPRVIAIVFFIGALGLGLCEAKPAANASEFWLNDATLEASRRNRIVLENMLDRAAGGVVRLPAGVIHVDRAVMIKPEHSGVTIQGEGPQSVLQNSHDIETFWTNPSLVALGTGLGYEDDLDGRPTGSRVTLKKATAQENYRTGRLAYAWVWDGYTKPEIGQLTTRRRVVRPIGLRDLELDGPIDARCNKLKWLDAAPIRGPKESESAVSLEDPADLRGFRIGQTVLITDGPTMANEARGEFRTITAIDRTSARVQVDRPFRCSYAAAAALVRVHVVKDVTLKDFTIGKPPHPEAVAASFKFCTGWRMQNVHCKWYLAIGGSAQFMVTNCNIEDQTDLNTAHDIQILSSQLRGLYLEEGCFDIGVTDCKIGPSVTNGVYGVFHCERMRLTRVHITESTVMPIVLGGRQNTVESVVVDKTKDSQNLCYIDGEGTTTTDLTSDVGVVFRDGLRQKVSNVRAPAVALGDPKFGSESGGTARKIQTPKLTVESKKWTVEPNVDGSAKPR